MPSRLLEGTCHSLCLFLFSFPSADTRWARGTLWISIKWGTCFNILAGYSLCFPYGIFFKKTDNSSQRITAGVYKSIISKISQSRSLCTRGLSHKSKRHTWPLALLHLPPPYDGLVVYGLVVTCIGACVPALPVIRGVTSGKLRDT